MTFSRRAIVLFTCCTLLLFHLIFVFAGFYGGDDINFSRYAADFAHNGFSTAIPTDHFQLRWTTIFVTGLFYKVWGVNAFTSALFSFICVCLSGLILHKLARRQPMVVYLFTLVLFFFSRAMIFYSHRLLADPAICLSVLAMYYFYRSVNYFSTSDIANGIAFSLALLFGIMTKETIVIALPLFVLLFLEDIYRKRNAAFWVTAAGFSIVLVFLYLLYFRVTTGDFLFRYHLLLQRSYMNICSFDQLPFINTLRRVGYELWDAMLLNGDLLIIFPAVAGVIYSRKAAIEAMDKYAFIALILCANFMTISWRNYVPLCHDPRHFIFVIPFAALVGGPMMSAYFRKPKDFIILPLLFLAASLLMIFRHDGGMKYLYLLCSILTGGAWLFSSDMKFGRWGYPLLFILVLFINYGFDFIKPLYPFHEDHKNIMKRNFLDPSLPASVYSDSFTGEMSEYFRQFQPGKIRFLPDDSIRPVSSGPLYYLLNDKVGREDVYQVLQALPLEAIAKDSSGKMVLYQVNGHVLNLIKATANISAK